MNWKEANAYLNAYDKIQAQSQRYKYLLEQHLKALSLYTSILDFGAGTGNLAVELLKKGKQVTVIEPNKIALDILKRKCLHFRANLVSYRGDDNRLEEFPPNSFDAITSSLVLPFPRDIPRHIANLKRVIKPGGILCISAWAYREDIEEGAINKLEAELKEKKLLEPENPNNVIREWDTILQGAHSLTATILERKLSRESLEQLLKTNEFSVAVEESAYKEYAYFLTAKSEKSKT